MIVYLTELESVYGLLLIKCIIIKVGERMGDCCSNTMKYAGRVAVGTVTARAVNEGINAGINKYKQHQNQKQNNNNYNNNNNNGYNYNNNYPN